MSELTELVGKTFSEVKNTGDEIQFLSDGGKDYRLYHSQDCCEHVYVEDVIGNLADLTGSPIVSAEEISSEGTPPQHDGEESFTWTFYRIGTAKGSVTIRFYGSSNGYYSESVEFGEFR